MPMTDQLFTTPADFECRFADGLENMLARHDGLGVHILALANATQDADLWRRLGAALAGRHARHQHGVVAALRAGRGLDEPDDDLMVFLKLMAIGFDRIGLAETRQVGDWEVQFNPIRALRPPRVSHARVEGLRRPFDEAGFHFDKPFLERELLWRGRLADRDARLLYNKFPFAPLHGLLVPEPERHLPQWLTPELHGWAWEVAATAGAALPGFGLAYNSYGAYASVNHLHFQTFVRARPLPVDAGIDHPLTPVRHDDLETAWFHLDELHQLGQPYNLLYGAGGLTVIARARQGEVAPPAWSAGFAWSETAGVFTVYRREEFEALDAERIRAALARHRV